MKPLRPGGVPLHPAVVHFPVAFWTAALALDGAAYFTGRADLWEAARLALAAGAVTGLAAMATGLWEYLAVSRTARASLIERHALLAGLAWTVFTFNWLWRVGDGTVPGDGSWSLLGYPGCSAAGFLCLLAAGHAGARLVYRHGVGLEGNER